MTPSHKSTAIVTAAGLLAAGAFLLSRASAHSSEKAAPALGGPTAALAGSMTIDARLAAQKLLLGPNETHIAVTVTAPRSLHQKTRTPVNLAIVLDRSGSMAGDKLEQAKAAARELIAQLAETDRFAVVTYGTDVTTIFPSSLATADGRYRAGVAIDMIYDDGGTNLSGGLVAGAAQIQSHPMQGSLSRVVLISDGHANEGIIDANELASLAAATAERGISTTTVGVGLDFDERAMSSIAISGQGNYYFAEHAGDLGQMFASELDTLGDTVASGVRLTLAPADGVDVLEAYGYPLERTTAGIFVPIADMRGGETRKVVFRVRTNAQSPGNIAVAALSVRYHDVEANAARAQQASITAVATMDRAAVDASRDKDANRHVERARSAKTLEEATVLYESGQPAAAEALLDHHFAQSAAMAEELGDDGFADELKAVSGKAKNTLKPAPKGSSDFKRGAKSSRKAAYELAK